jgi:molybdopterin-binding protein
MASMNEFKGNIKSITSDSLLNLVKIGINTCEFSVLTLELNERFKEGIETNLFFKETEIILTKDTGCIIGSENIVEAVILEVVKGSVLSEILLGSAAGNFKAVLTNISIDSDVVPGLKVYALIKACAITLGL